MFHRIEIKADGSQRILYRFSNHLLFICFVLSTHSTPCMSVF